MDTAGVQIAYGVHFDWGPVGASQVPAGGPVAIVDVLSFTTAVSVAVERGIDVTAERPWSPSPAAVRTAPTSRRLVLPSAIAAAAEAGIAVEADASEVVT